MSTKFPANSPYLANEEVLEVLRPHDIKPLSPNERNKPDFVTPEVHKNLPFERIDENSFRDLINEHHMEAVFDEIDVREHMTARSAMYESLEDGQKELIEKALIQYANDNEGKVLSAMRFTGRETDRTLADELEAKYGVNMDKIRIATEVFRITYALWESKNINEAIYSNESQRPTQEQLNKITQRLNALKESASFLEHFQVPATHSTNPDAVDIITEGEVLLKSDTSTERHFEGDGVYAGIMGSYKNYQDKADEFFFNVPLADTLPIITKYNHPEAMVSILGEGLDIKKRENIIATASGLVQWRQLENTAYSVDDWKVLLLENYLGTEVAVDLDTTGVETVIADTDLQPIYWALAARALRLPRFIPASELSKSDLAA